MRLTFALLVLPLALVACKKDPKPTDTDTDPGTDDPAETAPEDWGAWLALEALPDGRLAAAYYDREDDALGFAAGTVAGDGTVAWDWEEVDSYPDENGLNPGDAGKYASMAVAADGTVWVAYQDTSNGTLKYARRDPAGAWTTGIADVGGGARSDAGHWASIALAPGDAPVIAHHDEGQGDLRVARWDGTRFVGEVVDTGSDYTPSDTATEPADADVGEYARLLVGADGTEYVAYYDRAWGRLQLATRSGDTWSVETVDDSGDVGQWPDLVMDGSTLHIAYQDVTNQDLELASGQPGAWTTQTLDAGDGVGADTAIWVDGGKVGTFYFDGKNNDLKVAQDGGSGFATRTVGSDGALGYHNETVVVGGARYVGCYDYTHRTVWIAKAD